MERRPSCRGCPSCLTTLLGASILSSCFLLTEGQGASIQVLLKPPYPAEGQDVELALTTTPGDAVQKAVSCVWFRGLIADRNKLIYTYFISTNIGSLGVASTGRETVEPGCSLRIKNVATGDSGNYTVYLSGPDILAMGQASMVVSDHLPESPAKSPGATAGIIVGCLAVTALIVGALLYFFLRARGQRVKTSTQTAAAPTTYENVSPFTQAESDSSAHSNDVYETLQHPDQSLYQQLNGSRPAGQPSALS